MTGEGYRYTVLCDTVQWNVSVMMKECMYTELCALDLRASPLRRSFELNRTPVPSCLAVVGLLNESMLACCVYAIPIPRAVQCCCTAAPYYRGVVSSILHGEHVFFEWLGSSSGILCCSD